MISFWKAIIPASVFHHSARVYLRPFKRRDLELHGASSKFTIKDPPHTASGKNFGWDDDP